LTIYCPLCPVVAGGLVFSRAVRVLSPPAKEKG